MSRLAQSPSRRGGQSSCDAKCGPHCLSPTEGQAHLRAQWCVAPGWVAFRVDWPSPPFKPAAHGGGVAAPWAPLATPTGPQGARAGPWPDTNKMRRVWPWTWQGPGA